MIRNLLPNDKPRMVEGSLLFEASIPQGSCIEVYEGPGGRYVTHDVPFAFMFPMKVSLVWSKLFAETASMVAIRSPSRKQEFRTSCA